METRQEKVYVFSREGAKKFMVAQYIARIPLFIIATIVGVYIGVGDNGENFIKYPVTIVIMVLIIGGAMFVGYKLGVARGIKNAMLEKYSITDTTVQKIAGTGNKTSIELNNITKHRQSKIGLLIYGDRKRMLIPSYLDGYDELSNLILKNRA